MAGANRYTTAELLVQIKQKGRIPPSQTPFDDPGLLNLAWDELSTGILRQILSTRENYYLTSIDYAYNANSTYPIPTRAIGGALATIKIINGTVIYEVARSEIGEQFSTVTSPTGYYSFIIEGSNIVIQPTSSTGTIRLYYYQRPNTLVQTTSAAQITGISGTTLSFSAGTIPSTISTSTPCDLVQDQPPFDWAAIDQTPTAVTSTTIQFSSLPSNLAIGDWVALAGQTPVPQIPVEFRNLLVQRTIVKYNEIQGYLDKMKASQQKLEEMEKDVFELINPRVSEEQKRIVPSANVIGGYRRWRAWRAT